MNISSECYAAGTRVVRERLGLSHTQIQENATSEACEGQSLTNALETKQQELSSCVYMNIQKQMELKCSKL